MTFTGGTVGEYRDGTVISCTSGGDVPYAVLAGDTLNLFTGPTDGNPGWLDTWARVVPLAHVDLDISPKAIVDRTGALTISGTGTSDPEGVAMPTHRLIGLCRRKLEGH